MDTTTEQLPPCAGCSVISVFKHPINKSGCIEVVNLSLQVLFKLNKLVYVYQLLSPAFLHMRTQRRRSAAR